MNKNFPFEELSIDGRDVRVFSEDTDPRDLIWHRDAENRVIRIIESNGWKLQRDNSSPTDLEPGVSHFVKAGSWHRVIKGHGPLVVEVKRNCILMKESELRNLIGSFLVSEDVRKRGNQYCAYVDDKLTKAEKEGNPKKYKGKKVGSVQRTKSGKIRMKARACYASKKKANNAMAAAMMG